MKTIATNHPPTAHVEGSEVFNIFVRLCIPPVSLVCPAGNLLGPLLLHRLFEARLQLAGLNVERQGASGEFNNSIYLVGVNSLAPALEEVTATLAELVILSAAQVGWIDEREGIIRLVHPIKGMAIALPSAEIQANQDALDRLRKLAELLKTLFPLPPVPTPE